MSAINISLSGGKLNLQLNLHLRKPDSFKYGYMIACAD